MACASRVAPAEGGKGSVLKDEDVSGITVMDRATGLTVREHVPAYIRVAMKIMYGNTVGSHATTSSLIVRLLHHMSAKQGVAMNSPSSVKKIQGFIHTHNLNKDELLDPVDSFKSFNEFFYRKLKPSARPIFEPANRAVAVSPADARTVVFRNLTEATTIWVKGSEFTVERLLGPDFADVASNYVGGSLMISRLAPQDYHRFHMGVAGRINRRAAIDGALYTVNPVAVRQSINVYTENKRVVNEVVTEDFGNVMVVCVGATIVGSILHTADVGASVEKGDELGYFAFGGSTLLTLFPPGSITFDEDLVTNSSLPLETLLQMGMRVGTSTRPRA